MFLDKRGGAAVESRIALEEKGPLPVKKSALRPLLASLLLAITAPGCRDNAVTLIVAPSPGADAGPFASKIDGGLQIAGPCANQTCSDHGTCTAAGDAFVCECVTGYEGALCAQDIDECEVDNGGCGARGTFICSNGIFPGDSPRCSCEPQFQGPGCSEFTEGECIIDQDCTHYNGTKPRCTSALTCVQCIEDDDCSSGTCTLTNSTCE